MPPSYLASLREKLANASDCSGRFLWGATASVSLDDLLRGTSLAGGKVSKVSSGGSAEPGNLANFDGLIRLVQLRRIRWLSTGQVTATAASFPHGNHGSSCISGSIICYSSENRVSGG